MSRYKEIADRMQDLESDIARIDEVLKYVDGDGYDTRQFTFAIIADATGSSYNQAREEKLRDLATVDNQAMHEGLYSYLVLMRSKLLEELDRLKTYLERMEQILAKDMEKQTRKKTVSFLDDF